MVHPTDRAFVAGATEPSSTVSAVPASIPCAVRLCDMCGTECPKYWTRCEGCRLSVKFGRAVEVEDDGGPYFEFGGDRYYHVLEDAAEDGVEWVAPCTKTYPRINGDGVLENLMDDMHEDASVDDLDGVVEFLAAVERFNEAQTTASYWADEKRRIRVPAIAIEAATADETGNTGSAREGESAGLQASPKGGSHDHHTE